MSGLIIASIENFTAELNQNHGMNVVWILLSIGDTRWWTMSSSIGNSQQHGEILVTSSEVNKEYHSINTVIKEYNDHNIIVIR